MTTPAITTDPALLERLPEVSDADHHRLEKYRRALATLTA